MKRPFQIHLSTAIALMFAAGALMWANLTPETAYYNYLHRNDVYDVNDLQAYVPTAPGPDYQFAPEYADNSVYFGWPAIAAERSDIFKYDPNESTEMRVPTFRYVEHRYTHRGILMIAIDLSVAALIFSLVWFFSEWLIRRRERKQPVS